jgi:hypothetical protein
MRKRLAVTNAIFAGTVVVLLLLAASGFALYLTNPPAAGMTETSTENMTVTSTTQMVENMTQTMTETATQTALPFVATPGQMFHGGWLVVLPTSTGQFAVSVHAEGLETTQGTGNIYIVEATSSSASMTVAPIGPNATSSEFEVGSDGVGNFFILLGQNPYTHYESVDIVFLQGMSMSNSTVVASAPLGTTPM